MLHAHGRRTVFSRIRQRIEKRIEDQQFKQQEAQKDNLLKGLMNLGLDQPYTLALYKQQLETAIAEGTSGWKSMIPGMQEHAGLPEVQNMLMITQVMTEKELANHKLITAREIQRISQKSGQSEDKVNALLRQFNLVHMIDKWIKIRRTNGAAVPDSVDEIFELMLTDRRGLPASGEFLLGLIFCNNDHV